MIKCINAEDGIINIGDIIQIRTNRIHLAKIYCKNLT